MAGMCHAQFFKPSATNFTAASLPAPVFMSPEECQQNPNVSNAQGVCTPATIALYNNTLWYWCGFKATHKTLYWFQAGAPQTNTIAATLIRKPDLMNCVIPNLQKNDTSAASNCLRVQYSDCSSNVTCSLRTFGLSMSADVCMVLYNRRNSSVKGGVQLTVNNFSTSSRNVGTVFAAIYGIAFALGILAAWYIKCTAEWKRPSYQGGHSEQASSLKQPLNQQAHQTTAPPAAVTTIPPSKVQALSDKLQAGWSNTVAAIMPGRRMSGKQDDNAGHMA